MESTDSRTRATAKSNGLKTRLLLLEDETGLRFALREFLRSAEFEVSEAESCSQALVSTRASLPDLILMDFALPDGDALSLLPQLRELAPHCGIVVLTGHGSINLAVRAIKSGADHFLTKPVQLDELGSILKGLAHQRRLERTLRAERRKRDRHPVDPFAGESPAIRRLAREAGRIAGSEAPVLITGPTGAGKGVLAQWLHSKSPRASEPFVDINCASLSREFLESELFGHQRGAFTGAVAAKPGLLEIANRGTLFLDEIGDMALEIQPRLLKVLEEGRFRRMGSVEDRHADVRLVAATHHDLATRSAAGQFREDLYFRIQTLPVRVPALSERFEDLPMLVNHILRDLSNESALPEARVRPECFDAMRRYDWPGNIRELRNVLERALLLSRDGEIRPEDLHFQPRRSAGKAGAVTVPSAEGHAHLPLEEVERRHILATLEAHAGNVRKAAEVLGVPRSSLYQKLQRFGIPTPRRAGNSPAS